jgi:hypothetical protein
MNKTTNPIKPFRVRPIFIMAIILAISLLIGQNIIHYPTITQQTTPKLTNIGYSPYAIFQENFECDKFIKSTKEANQIHLSTLWDSFGDKRDCLLNLLSKPRLKSLQIHILNEVCQRNGNCGAADFLRYISVAKYHQLLVTKDKAFLRQLRLHFKSVNQFLKRNLNPWTTCYISPGLESNLDYTAGKIVVDLARKAFPDCLITWNTMKLGTDSRIPTAADLTETHSIYSSLGSPAIFNLDGTDISFVKRPSFRGSSGWYNPPLHEGAELDKYMAVNGNKSRFVFLWTFESNCQDTGKTGPRIQPLERTCKSTNAYELVGQQVVRSESFPRTSKDVWTYRELDIFKDCIKVFKTNNLSVKAGATGGSDWTISQNAKTVEIYTFSKKMDLFTFSSQDPVTLKYIWKSLLSPDSYPLRVGLKIQLQNDKLVCYQIDDVTDLQNIK